MLPKIIAIDLDGTLLGDDTAVSQPNRDALIAAQEAGILIVPCTGRSWRESVRPLQNVANLTAGVFVTGAVVTDMPTGKTLDLSVIEPHLVARLVAHLDDAPEAVLILQEVSAAGCDYLVAGQGQLSENTKLWFQASGAKVQYAKQLPTVDQLHHALRVAVVAGKDRMEQLVAGLSPAFEGLIQTHYFHAMKLRISSQPMFVLEIFAMGVDKWRGIQWVAQQQNIQSHHIVAIGDQINDMSMIQNAGLAIAMGNAIEVVKHAAHHTTKTNNNHGIAHAIHQILNGNWSHPPAAF